MVTCDHVPNLPRKELQELEKFVASETPPPSLRRVTPHSCSMEFVPNVGSNLISRYEPHPTAFKAKEPSSYNPTGGAKFMPRLSPSSMGNPTMTTTPSPQRSPQKWSKGGWAAGEAELVQGGRAWSPPPQNHVAPMRGGWPVGGEYSRGGGEWFTDAPPQHPSNGSFPTYQWQTRQFLRPTA